MREILFRGKKLDSGEWIYGDFGLVSSDEGVYTLMFSRHYKEFGFGLVDPATVGQYTGLTDMAGKKIFEGDIIRYPISPIRFPKRKSPVYTVLWDEAGGFTIFTDDNGFDPKSIEVIGNVYDNPELLEGSHT